MIWIIAIMSYLIVLFIVLAFLRGAHILNDEEEQENS